MTYGTSYQCDTSGSIYEKLIAVATNFVLYWTFHPQYQTDVYNAGAAVWNGLQQDVLATPFPYPPAYNWTLREQIENRGYLYEEHDVITEDGYILKAFRVPGKQGSVASPGQPVIMQHGLIDDGGTWFFNDATLDLSLELVDLLVKRSNWDTVAIFGGVESVHSNTRCDTLGLTSFIFK